MRVAYLIDHDAVGGGMEYIRRKIAARAGDECVLLGRQGGRGISVFDWASLKATHPHDILCAIGPRVRRVCAG